MRKLIIVGLVLALIAAIALWRRDSPKVSYVNGLPQYTTLPGREYIFERDCYIFKFNENNTQYPVVGANVPGLSSSIGQLPPEVSEKNLGTQHPGVRILDVVRVGARFKIISVRREERRHSTAITFEILFLDEADRKYPRLDAYWIMDHSPERSGTAPKISEDFAVERVKI